MRPPWARGPYRTGPPPWARDPRCAPRGFGPAAFVRARLHRRLFMWFAASILLTAVAVAVSMRVSGANPPGSWQRDVDGMKSFLAGRFDAVWDDPAARDALAAELSTDFHVGVRLEDERHVRLSEVGPYECSARSEIGVPVAHGAVRVCFPHRYGFWRGGIAVFAAIGALWLAAGLLARRLARPLGDMARVAHAIGEGHYEARMNVGRHHHGEIAVLGHSMNDMAAKIQKQLADQRELLAAVSHEIRTPLARIRLLLEMPKEQKTFDEIEREVVEIDELVGELLASSRLEFQALSTRRLDVRELAARALERAGAPPEALVVEGEGEPFVAGDATLLARALANLIDNAKKHGGGLATLRVARGDDEVRFDAEDDGPGVEPGEEEQLFAPFYRRGDSGTLGLGLALVKRIAVAHGGQAHAATREGGGARIGFSVPVAQAVDERPSAA